jgi:hypothetical protein
MDGIEKKANKEVTLYFDVSTPFEWLEQELKKGR